MDESNRRTLWSQLLRATRKFLDDRGFLEVTTPVIVPVGAFEGVIDTLSVEGLGELQTSPEIAMKSVLASEGRSIYQICPCFRDDPISDVHRKEFTLLEFYRVGVDYKQLIGEMKEYIQFVSSQPVVFEDWTMNALFEKYVGFVPSSQRKELQNRAASVGVRVTEEDTWNDIFFKIMIEQIEPKLDPDIAYVVRDYPVSIAGLSERRGEVAEKFEIYWQGMEICNGCTELSDREELHRRSKLEAAERTQRGHSPHGDSLPLEASTLAMPHPVSGVAVGLNRLFGALHGECFFP